MLEHTKTEKRKERHKITQEDFTPKCVIDIMLDNMDNNSLFKDFSKTFCDPCIGIGYIYIEVLKRRLKYCKTNDDIINAISTMYGTELMEDNVNECKYNISSTIYEFCDILNINIDKNKINDILNENIVCTDFFNWDYDNWQLKSKL